ncbi:putative dehydrogenase [Rhizomicrobium palustre]|uniref:Putative dehydrogenase n=1 Tax=Rhizomicrobium palustre TaxID=189966 RepID=A0A846N3I2_9PROT|nr:Gfo/Idh/MocA family oxidoreductase [Rhizomicrobium palustre]NIK89667.1 putative dehydrogenase [Rhizomicrobium palustre]
MTSTLSRRGILKAGLALAAFPAIIPERAFGANARLNIGAIGVGRISRGHDLKEVFKISGAQVLAVCDVDSKRLALGKQLVDETYTSQSGKSWNATITYANYRELLANKDLDTVIISTPDHQHATLAVHAARAGKHIYLQKPAALTIAEGRIMADEVKKTGKLLQIGSQQRSDDPWPQFRKACELVRNGRIGALKHVEIGLPGDPSGPEAPQQPVPPNLNYDAWLGSTPEVYYTEMRVHPQDSFDRPGWLRCEQFTAGMITGWGSHHVDTAHWAMDMEHSGPVEIWGEAEFPKSGLWNVHGKFLTHARYANGVTMDISGDFPNGVKFIGEKGWIFVARSGSATASDPKSTVAAPPSFAASDPKILDSVIGPNEIHLHASPEQHADWVRAILTGAPMATDAEIGHRANSTCLLHFIAMHLKRRLTWDPVKERFKNDDEANAMLSRPMRPPYTFE